MKLTRIMRLAVLVGMASATKHGCQCPCACPAAAAVDGRKLKDLINCFATWEKGVATDGYSQLDGCEEKDVVYCKTTGNNGHFCKFDGTNNLADSNDAPSCFYNCGMEACTSWLVAHKPEQVKCIADVYQSNGSGRFLRN